MVKQKLDRKRALAWRVVFSAAFIAAAVYVLVAHWHTVSTSLHAARHADVSWLVLSVVLMVLTFCIAAAIFSALALHPIRYRQTVLVQVAAALVSRLLPAGLGGLGLNGVYLYKRGHTPAEATTVSSVNNVIGMCAHLLLLAVVLLLQPHLAQALFTHYHVHVPWIWVALAAALLAVICMLPVVSRKLLRLSRNLLVSVKKEHRGNLLRALLLAGLLTATYVLLLFSVARSIGAAVNLFQAFIVFSCGMLVGTATPTPGGLVGTEAGLFAGFVSYGVPSAEAGAAVLLFRLITYWLPLVPGLFALLVARNRKLL